MDEYIQDAIKGLIVGLLYLFITKENDTSVKNLLVFIIFFITVSNGARLAGIDPNVVVTAFITKSVFTIVDQRIKIYNRNQNKQQNN